MGQRRPLMGSLLRMPRVEPVRYPPASLKSSETAKTATVVLPKDPIYPAIAKERCISGLVEVCFRIAPDGRVYDVSAKHGPSVLVQAAVQAVAARRYEPARVNGVAIDAQATAQFDFRMS
jgi:TonB family protein